MNIDHKLFEEVWEDSAAAWEAFQGDARTRAGYGYHEAFLREAFIAGMVSGVMVMEERVRGMVEEIEALRNI
jgi:hypothetical protein